MENTNKSSCFKQTALLMLCGLLPMCCIAQQRSKSDAINIANDFISCDFFKKGVKEVELRAVSSNISQKNKLQKGKEAYYIFTAPSNEDGFVIVSGDERMPKVLAYSDDNNFEINNIPPNVRYWLDCYAEAFLALDIPSDNEKSLSGSANQNEVAPIIDKNKWGQGDPFNRLCPTVGRETCVTGCVATAMAQVMKYYSYPSVGMGSVNYTTETNKITIQHDFSSDHFKWDDMLYDYSGKCSSEQISAVAELMLSCGASVMMDYGTDEQGGSGSYQKKLITAFIDNFGYDKDAALMVRSYCSTEDWHNLLINELNEGRPVNYGGISLRDGGHSFVLDGYRFNEINNFPDYHVNWGWEGYCNGYYQIADLHPVENGQHPTAEGFTSSQQMTIGIKPEDGIDNGHFYLCTPNLYVSSTTVKAGSTVQVYTASCVNYSYKEFSGSLHVALIPSDGGEEILLGESNTKTLSYLQELKNLNIEITLPSNLSEGQYTIQLRSKYSMKDEYNQVLSKKYPVIVISENGNESPIFANDAMLGCSELELLNVSDSSLISLRIYELQNLLETPFIGNLRMILADKQGKPLVAFGDSIQPGELSMLEIQENPIKIQGKLTGDWPDGNYKIYVGAKMINTTNYVYVSYYDITQPSMNYQELCLNAKIEKGKIIINGRPFIIIPTVIMENRIIPDTTDRNRYSLDGKGYGTHKSVSPIITITNGKKVLTKKRYQ